MDLKVMGLVLREWRGEASLHVVAAEIERTQGVKMTPQSIYLYEGGKVKEPSFTKLDALCRHYGRTIAELRNKATAEHRKAGSR